MALIKQMVIDHIRPDGGACWHRGPVEIMIQTVEFRDEADGFLLALKKEDIIELAAEIERRPF